MALTLEPMEDFVIVRPDTAKEITEAGLIIPEMAQEAPTIGTVIQVGPGRMDRGSRVPMVLEVGDRVAFPRYAGTRFSLEPKNELLLMKESEFLGRITGSVDPRSVVGMAETAKETSDDEVVGSGEGD